MEKYEYKAIVIEMNAWGTKAKADYLDVLNEMGAEGWKFIQFMPVETKNLKTQFEILFERKVLVPLA